MGLTFLLLFHFTYFLVIAYFVWGLPQLNFRSAKFKLHVIRNIRKYTLGVSVFSVIGVFFPILDKLFVSKYFNINILGYYSIVSMLGMGITQLIYPITSALFPNYTKLHFQNKSSASYYEFRFAFQLVGALSITFVSIFYIFSKEILFVWTANNILFENVSHIIFPFFIGILFYSFQIIPTLCISAIGDTKRLNIISLITIVLYLLLLTLSLGHDRIEYVAYAWMVSNIVLYILSWSLIKKITWRISFLKLFLMDMIMPLGVAVLSIFFIKCFNITLNTNNKWMFIVQLILAFLAIFLLVVQVNFVLKKKITLTISKHMQNLRFYK